MHPFWPSSLAIRPPAWMPRADAQGSHCCFRTKGISLARPFRESRITWQYRGTRRLVAGRYR